MIFAVCMFVWFVWVFVCVDAGVVLCIMLAVLVWWFDCLSLLLWLGCYCGCGWVVCFVLMLCGGGVSCLVCWVAFAC